MIIGINLNSINARVKPKPITGNISVNSTPRIVDVDKTEVLDMKDLLNIKFGLDVKYDPDVGEILMEGEVLYKTDDAKKALKKWKDEKKLDDNITVEVLNAIFRRCLTKAIELSADLRLPPPIRFPVVMPAENK